MKARPSAARLLRIERDLLVALTQEHDLIKAARLILDACLQFTGVGCVAIYAADAAETGLQELCREGGSGLQIEDVTAPAPRVSVVGDERRPTLALPIHHGDRLVAVIAVASRTRRPFPVATRDALRGLAARLSGAFTHLTVDRSSESERQRLSGLLDEMRSDRNTLSRIIDFLPDATFAIDCEKRVIAWNQAIEEMTGIKKDEMVGRSAPAYSLAFYGKARPLLIDLVADPPEEEAAYSYVRRRGSTLYAETYVPQLFGGRGADVWVTASPLLDEAGRRVGAIESVRDVTSRKEAERGQAQLRSQLTVAADEWRATFDAVPSVLVITDLAGTVVRCNATVRRLAGLTWPELIGRPIGALGPGEPWRAASLLVERAASAGSARAELVHGAAGKRSWTIEVQSLALEERRLIVVARDITGLIELEESVRRKEKMADMGALVGAVAHEVRNPLFGISGLLDALDAMPQIKAEIGPYLDGLRRETDRLTSVMQSLLEYGRPVSDERGATALGVMIGDAIQLCRRQAQALGVEMTATVADDVPPVQVDRARMLEVLRNLVENAVQHSPRGGAVVVTAALDRRDRRLLELTVRDRGPGFAAADREKVFEPFFTRRQGGTGLGLSIVQRVVTAHGGSVSADTHPDGGGVVTVWLPLTEGSLESHGQA